jgi:hypothetical protein
MLTTYALLPDNEKRYILLKHTNAWCIVQALVNMSLNVHLAIFCFDIQGWLGNDRFAWKQDPTKGLGRPLS